MQLKKTQLQRQQVIMSKLGYYRHKCDGIWGPASIEAKRKWERLSAFVPGLPTNGLPFGDRDYVPVGVRFDKPSRMFVLAGLTEEEIAGYLPKSESVEPEARPLEVIPVESPIAERTEELDTYQHAEPAQRDTRNEEEKGESRFNGPQFNQQNKKKNKTR